MNASLSIVPATQPVASHNDVVEAKPSGSWEIFSSVVEDADLAAILAVVAHRGLVNQAPRKMLAVR
jgi:hypothetical protein